MAILGVFEVIHEEIMQIGKSRTNEELWRFRITRMKIQEASEDLQMGGILFPKFQGKLFEDENLKTT